MIPIKKVKQIREDLGLTHIVIFGMVEGERNFVATHGKSAFQAKEASQYGNNLKKRLGWPLQLCRSEPLERVCKNCSFYKYPNHSDITYGIEGKCMVEPHIITRDREAIACHHFDPTT